MRASLSPRSVDDSFHAASVQTIKALAMDAVEQPKSGHPGMPMRTAEMAGRVTARTTSMPRARHRWPSQALLLSTMSPDSSSSPMVSRCARTLATLAKLAEY